MTESGGKSNASRKAARFGAVAALVLVAAMATLAFAFGAGVLGAGFHGIFALALGVCGAILLGVGLMSLSFYSDRSGSDDAVVGMGDDETAG